MKFVPNYYHWRNEDAIKTPKKKKKISVSNRNPKESLDLQRYKMYQGILQGYLKKNKKESELHKLCFHGNMQ